LIEQLIQFVSNLGHWAYVAIFLVVSLESAAFLGFFMPGETLVFLGGFLAAQGILELAPLIALVSIAAMIGDSVGYELGRWLGLEWLLRAGARFGLRKGLLAVERFFHKHGGKAVFLARFSAFFRIMVPFLAGASRMRYYQFLLYNVLGGAIWAAGSVLIGYLAGASWHIVQHWIGRAGAILAIVAVLLLVVIWQARRPTAD